MKKCEGVDGSTSSRSRNEALTKERLNMGKEGFAKGWGREVVLPWCGGFARDIIFCEEYNWLKNDCEG